MSHYIRKLSSLQRNKLLQAEMIFDETFTKNRVSFDITVVGIRRNLVELNYDPGSCVIQHKATRIELV